AGQLAVEGVDGVDRLEGVQVHRARRAVFLQCKYQALEVQHVRVRGAAAQPFDARIVKGRVAVHRKENPSRLFLRDVALGPRVARAVIDAAVLEPEHADVTFAVELDVARSEGILRVGTGRVEAAVQVVRNLALDLAVPDLDLGAQRRVVRAPAWSRARRRLGLIGLRVRRAGPAGGAADDGCRSECHAQEGPAVEPALVIAHYVFSLSRKPSPRGFPTGRAGGVRKYQRVEEPFNCLMYVCRLRCRRSRGGGTGFSGTDHSYRLRDFLARPALPARPRARVDRKAPGMTIGGYGTVPAPPHPFAASLSSRAASRRRG